MFRTASPYVEHLRRSGVRWQPYSDRTLETAIGQDKIIFLHIGSISRIAQRERAYALFEDPRVSETLNRHFIPILLDAEDVPEAFLIALDLLVINEQSFSAPINIFSLPDPLPFLSFSGADPDEFLTLCENIVRSFRSQREKLETMGRYLTDRLRNTGVVTGKEPPVKLNARLLHAYVRSWASKYLDLKGSRPMPFTLNSRHYLFLLKYARRYGKTRISTFVRERLAGLYRSPMFDPVEGGVFSQAADDRFREPLFEKSFSENIQAALLYSFAYRCFGDESFRQAAENIIGFLDNAFRSPAGGYMSVLSLKTLPAQSRYYTLTAARLKPAFPERYAAVGENLGLDMTLPADTPQIPCLAPGSRELEPAEKERLLQLREPYREERLYDTRMITADNCMYVSILCLIARNLGREDGEYLAKAERLLETLLEYRREDIRLYRYIGTDGKGYLDSDLLDYAMMLNALLHLHKRTGKERYRELVLKYTAFILLNYYQADNGMFSSTSKLERITPFKRESVIDYVRFSANSVMARNLFMLYRMRNDSFYLDAFRQQLYNVAPQLIGSGPLMVSWGLQILNYLTDTPQKKQKEAPSPDGESES